MRRTLTLARAATLAAAAVLLGACSGDEGSSASPSTSPTASPTTSASETSESEAPQGDSEFCTESQELLDGLGAAFSNQADPTSVETAFQEAAEGFRSVEPPADIEADWTTLGDGLEEFAAAFSELDESDPESVTAFQQRTSALQGELTGAATNVETYLNEECGIDTGAEPSASGSTAPSS